MIEGSIFVTTTAVDTKERPWLTANRDRVLRAARAYRGDDFRAVDEPEDAEFLLFVDSSERYLGDVARSRLYRTFVTRSYVHNANDGAVPVLPGMYADMPSPVRLPELQLGAFYLRSFDNLELAKRDESAAVRYLFSFVGNAANSPAVRRRVLSLQHQDALLVDRSSGMRDNDLDYVSSLRRSQFVICPRGLGPTSWRFYEAMMAGRVPVIVSDRWVPAREIDWPSFSLWVPEGKIEDIPRICEEHASAAPEMGRRARAEWERCCSLETAFGWIGRRLRELHRARGIGQWPSKGQLFADLRYRGELLKFGRWSLGRAVRRLQTGNH